MISLLRHSILLLAAGLTLAQPAGADEPGRSAGAAAAFPFEENVGQIPNGEVKYFARGLSETLFITGDGSLVYSLAKREEPGTADTALRRSRAREPEPANVKGWALWETFAGSQLPRIQGTGQSVAKVNYFKGNDPSAWRAGLSTYEAVLLEDIYPGIHLSVARRGNHFEKTFTVLPGADYRRIEGRIDGADRLELGSDGALEITTGLGRLSFTRPVAYQTVGDHRCEVDVRYVLRDKLYGFELGDYDRTTPVVIDPLLASTFLGASSDESAYAVAVDAHGSVYVAGYTYSAAFPTTAGAHDRSFAGPANRTDAFIAQFTSSLTQLVSSTIVGGDGQDYVNDLFCWRDLTTGTDYVFATGLTGSTDFPTSGSAYDRRLETDIPEGAIGVGGRNHEFVHQDAFVVKFSRNLDTLPASTLLGGKYHDDGTSLHVTREGNVYVTGWNYMGDFPTTPSAYYRTSNFGADQAFVAKLDVGLTRLLAGTYLGLSDRIIGRAIFVNRAYVGGQAVDLVYVAGETHPYHPDHDFPTTQNAYDETFNGGTSDAFVSKFDGTLQNLLASTFLGGASEDAAFGLVVNADDTVFVAGYTQSSDFPTTPDAFDTSFNGNQDAFVSRLDADLQRLMASTFLGGSGWEAVWAIDRDRCGNIYVAGESTTDRVPTDPLAFPTTPGAPDRTYNGAGDAILSMFDPRLESLFFSTFAGLEKTSTSASSLPDYIPDKLDSAFGIAVDNIRNAVYIAGVTASGTVGQSPVRAQPPLTYRMFPVLPVPVQGQATPQAYDITFNGGKDVFAAKYGLIICRWGSCDFNGDGEIDIVWRNTVTGENRVWFMNRTTRMGSAAIEKLADKNWKIEGVADFNADGQADLLWRNASTGQNTVWYMNGATHGGTATVEAVSNLSWQIGGVGDFNSDGYTDIVWRNAATGDNSLWLMNGISHSGSVTLDKQADLNWKIVAVGDINGDGFSDIVWRNTSTGQNAVWYYSDTARTGTANLDTVSDQNWKVVLISDFNSDGKNDILWRNSSTGENSVWSMSDVTRTGATALERVTDVSWIVATQLESGSAPPVTSAVTVDITTPTTSPTTTATSPFAAIGGMATSVNPLATVTWTTDRGSSGGGAFTAPADAAGTRTWRADIPLFAGSNAVTVTATDNMGTSRTDTVNVTVSSFIYYLAEGATGPFWDLDLAIANPNAVAAPITITFLKGDATTVPYSTTLLPNSRTTIPVEKIPELENTATSSVVTSTTALPLVVERSMFWDARYYGSHGGTAVSGPATRWYFAEGSQSIFDTYVLLANANTTAGTATVQFLVEDPAVGVVTRTVALPPTSRTNVVAGAVPQLRGKSFSIVVDATVPIIAERAMYFGPGWKGGHESIGVTAPATSWFLAEGSTGMFSEWVLVGNPNATPANVTLTYLLPSGQTIVRPRTMGPNSRLTVPVMAESPALANTAVSTTVTSDVPVIVERAMYWPASDWGEAHNSFGVTETALKWGLAEGRVGGPLAFATYILLANPNAAAAQVRVTFLRMNGTTVTKDYTVDPTSRFNVAVNAMVTELQNEHFSAVVEVLNGVPIAVERAMYNNDAAGNFWAAGTNATAVRLP